MINQEENTALEKTPFWKDRRYIIGSIITLLGIILGIYQEWKSDFMVSVKTSNFVICQSGRNEIVASIKNTSIFCLDYKYPVNLDIPVIQQDIKFTLSPVTPTLPNFVSKTG